jgi:CRP/FNR family transcriptional regulator
MEHLSFLQDVEVAESHVPAGTYLFREHEGCGRIGFVVSGSVRVFKEHPSGRSITLYRLGAGDSCILSMTCALSHPIHQASAIVEDAAVLLMITTEEFRKLVARSSEARDYVFSLFASRLTDVLLLLEEVVFQRMDERLAALLLEHSARTGLATIDTTHERLADEAGTVREVVTRILGDFARRGAIEVQRGKIAILDKALLSGLHRSTR